MNTLLLILILNITTHSQMENDLGKYSYPIFTFDNDIQHSGTAFFYQKNDTTYLVSNYHAIKGMSPMHTKLNYSPQKLYLKYPVLNSDKEKVIEIDISEEKIGKTEIFYFADRIDLLKIVINRPEDAEINYINELIDIEYLNKIPDSVYIFGYPNPNMIDTKFWSKLSLFKGKYSENGFDEFYIGALKKYPLFKEKERMFGMQQYYYFIKPYIVKGYSGSPVIGKFTTESNETVYKFIGVNFGNEPLSNQTWIIRGDIAFDYLNE